MLVLLFYLLFTLSSIWPDSQHLESLTYLMNCTCKWNGWHGWIKTIVTMYSKFTFMVSKTRIHEHTKEKEIKVTQGEQNELPLIFSISWITNQKAILLIFIPGTFLQPIPPNATWTFLARYGSSSEHESGSVDFCTSMDSSDQPPPYPHSHRRPHSCPPEKGFALIMMSAWVMPMFIVPVSCNPLFYFLFFSF